MSLRRPRSLVRMVALLGAICAFSMLAFQADSHGQLVVAGSILNDSASGDFYSYVGNTNAPEIAVNNSGVAIGNAVRFQSGTGRGRAVRWDASGASAVELGNLAINPRQPAFSRVYGVNDAGTAVGHATNSQGEPAVKWEAGGVTAIELASLASDASGYFAAGAFAISQSGIIVGGSDKFTAEQPGQAVGTRAVRWFGPGPEITELGHLGTSTGGAHAREPSPSTMLERLLVGRTNMTSARE